MWVKIRASEAERAEWHAKARSAGLTLSDLERRSVGRARPWTVAHAEVERERTRELARIGANLNQIARWANTFKANAEAVEIVAHLVAIERASEVHQMRMRWLVRTVVVDTRFRTARVCLPVEYRSPICAVSNEASEGMS